MSIPDLITFDIAFKKTNLSSEIFFWSLINLFSGLSLPKFQYEWNNEASSYKYVGILCGSSLLLDKLTHLGHSEIFLRISISSFV